MTGKLKEGHNYLYEKVARIDYINKKICQKIEVVKIERLFLLEIVSL